jgi:hypothetical protein
MEVIRALAGHVDIRTTQDLRRRHRPTQAGGIAALECIGHPLAA